MRINITSQSITYLIPLIVSGLIQCCSSAKNEDTSKFNNYYRQGEQLYIIHCSNCHQTNGAGLGRIYPPLNKSDFMDTNFEKTLCLMKYGIEGEVVINGITYNQPMPGVFTLTDLEVAEIATYVYNSWSNNKGLIEVNDVSRILNACEQ